MCVRLIFTGEVKVNIRHLVTLEPQKYFKRYVEARITSYNVCYTKLLRLRIKMPVLRFRIASREQYING